MNRGEQMKRHISKLVSSGIKGADLTSIAYGELIKINPPTFQFEHLPDPLDNEFIITPNYKVFVDEDIGKKYVFMKNAGGQTYFYLYEAAPQGENGVEYKWQGRIDECNLIGECPDGAVVVTHGTIELAVHERRKE